MFLLKTASPVKQKCSARRRTPRKGIWLLTQPRSGASVRQAHTFLFPSSIRRHPPANRKTILRREDMKDQLEKIKREALEKIDASDALDKLNDIRVAYLG